MESDVGAFRKVRSVRWKVIPPEDCNERQARSRPSRQQPSIWCDLRRVRTRCLQQRAVASILMSTLHPGDIAAYRDARLQGKLGDPPVKGATVNTELELRGRVIALARRE